MEVLNSVQIVQQWLDAVNTQNLDRLLALSSPQIELLGPRGGGRGYQLLRDWMGRAGLSLNTGRCYARGNRVVVAQHGVWHAADTGAVLGEADLASRFVVVDQQVALYARYDDLASALRDTELARTDEYDSHDGEGHFI